MRPPRLQALVSQTFVPDPPKNVQYEIHTPPVGREGTQ
jgi:hypothetical protein